MKRFLVVYACIFGTHVLGQFLLYGHAQALPSVARNVIGVFLVPLILALLAYFGTIRQSPLFRSKLRSRPAKVFALSLISSIASLYAGVFWAFNIYGT
jgi:hypothetical protein